MATKSIQDRISELFPESASEIIEIYNFKKLESYYFFLQEFNERGGFFSKSDSEHILERHIIESMFHIFKITKAFPVSHETKIVDIGSGPGLPGYIFFALNNYPSVTLVDSQRRRLGLLEEFHKHEFSDKQVKFLYERVEAIKEKFDLVVMRSTVKYPWSAEIVSSLMKTNSTFIPFLGKRNYDLEFENIMLENLGLKIEEEIDLNELKFLGQRHIKLLKKTTESKKGYPRAWEIITKEIKRTIWEK